MCGRGLVGFVAGRAKQAAGQHTQGGWCSCPVQTALPACPLSLLQGAQDEASLKVAEEKFKKLQEAYEALSDPAKVTGRAGFSLFC